MRAPDWRAHGVRERTIRKPLWQRTVDSTASVRSVWQTLHNDAVGSTVRGRRRVSAVRARARKPVCENECPNMSFASRCA
eukprot:11190923-Lingulodinium_polyedra.AAC.1